MSSELALRFLHCLRSKKRRKSHACNTVTSVLYRPCDWKQRYSFVRFDCIAMVCLAGTPGPNTKKMLSTVESTWNSAIVYGGGGGSDLQLQNLQQEQSARVPLNQLLLCKLASRFHRFPLLGLQTIAALYRQSRADVELSNPSLKCPLNRQQSLMSCLSITNVSR